MISRKVFLRYKKWFDYHPIDTKERIFYWDKGIRYILAFKENNNFRCLCSRKNKNKILGEE